MSHGSACMVLLNQINSLAYADATGAHMLYTTSRFGLSKKASLFLGLNSLWVHPVQDFTEGLKCLCDNPVFKQYSGAQLLDNGDCLTWGALTQLSSVLSSNWLLSLRTPQDSGSKESVQLHAALLNDGHCGSNTLKAA